MQLGPVNSTFLRVLQWVIVALILKVCIIILLNYVDYFPANFESHFLIGRRDIFRGLYRIAFYVHILCAPVTLLQGLFLISDSMRNRFRKTHRVVGRVQVALILLLLTPSSLVMANYSIAGRVSNFGFIASSIPS